MGRILLYICGAFVLVVGAEIGVLFMMYHSHAENTWVATCTFTSPKPGPRIAACTALIKWDRAHGQNTYMPLNSRGGAYIQKADLEGLHGEAGDARADYRLAVRDFNRILYYNQSDATALNNRCWARMLGGEPLQIALDDCNRAIAIMPQANVLQSRALVYLKMGKLKESIADSDAASRQQPYMAAVLIVRGIAEVRSGNRSAGSADIAKAAAIDPSVIALYTSYGVMPK